MTTEYRVAWGRGVGSLSTIVMTYIERGWLPLGGVSVRECGRCYQTMTRNPETVRCAICHHVYDTHVVDKLEIR